MKFGIQPANTPLAYYLTIPQWRCKLGHWNDVSAGWRCYACSEQATHCTECGGDGEFEEAGSGCVSRCMACEGYGKQWDWPDKGSRAQSDDASRKREG
jgi:hypothetical protein